MINFIYKHARGEFQVKGYNTGRTPSLPSSSPRLYTYNAIDRCTACAHTSSRARAPIITYYNDVKTMQAAAAPLICRWTIHYNVLVPSQARADFKYPPRCRCCTISLSLSLFLSPAHAPLLYTLTLPSSPSADFHPRGPANARTHFVRIKHDDARELKRPNN